MGKTINKGKEIAQWLETHPVWTGAFLGIICILFFSWLQWSPSFPDPDSFFHAAVSVRIKEDKSVALTEFPWLPLTILPDIYADQAWLYHVLLLPFVSLFPPLIGMKIATALISTILVLFIFFILTTYRVRFAWLSILVLLATNPFVFRISLAKTTALSVLLFLVGIFIMLRTESENSNLPPSGGKRNSQQQAVLAKFWNKSKTYFLLAAVSALYALTHGSWPLLVVAGAVYWVVSSLSLSVRTVRGKLAAFATNPARRVFFATAIGSAVGILLHPSFPNNIAFMWYQTVLIALQGFKNVIEVGSEWYGFAPSELIGSSVFIASLTLIATIFFFASLSSQKTPTRFLFTLTAILLALTLNARRNSEFFLPTALLFSSITLSNIDKHVWRPFQNTFRKIIKEHQRIALTIAVYFAAAVGVILARDTIRIGALMHDGIPWKQYQNAAAWMENTLPSQTPIVHLRWESFPPLFLFAPSLRYTAGMDPAFFYLADKERFHFWKNLREATRAPSGEEFSRMFETNTIMIEKEFATTYQAFSSNPQWKKVYEDKDVWIFQWIP